MKRLFTLLLTLAMILSLAACSQPPEPEFTLGTVSGLTYENSFIGIGCTLDSEWTYYSEEQIKEMNNIASDMAGEEFKEQVKNATIVYDMLAVHSNPLRNININLEKVDPVQLALIDLADNLEKSFPSIEQAMKNMGYTNIVHEISKVKIGDEEFDCLNNEAEINGIKIYQTVISIKCHGYIASISIGSDSKEDINTILGYFYTVE